MCTGVVLAPGKAIELTGLTAGSKDSLAASTQSCSFCTRMSMSDWQAPPSTASGARSSSG